MPRYNDPLMADNVSISYSFQTGPAVQTPQAAPPTDHNLVAFTDCEQVNLGNGSVLLLNRGNGKQMTITADVAVALTHCTTFKTLSEHAQTLVQSIPQLQGQLADVTKVLNLVNDAGLMLRAQDVCDRLSPDSAPVADLRPTRVCIITCDRPGTVERLLDSMLRSGKLSRHDELLMIDDSRDSANGELNRGLVAKFNLTSTKNMHYVGAVEQRRMLAQLIAAQPQDEPAIRFLLDRERWAPNKSYGLSRSMCLLLSVGYRCIVLDDDVLCHSVIPPIQQQGISFDDGNGREMSCFTSAQDLQQQAVYSDTDPLSGHARCLGMKLSQAIRELGIGAMDQATLRNADASMLNTLQTDSPILVTQCGSWGDPGTANSNWFQNLGPDSISRLLASPGGLQSAMENRHYWLGATRPNIRKMAVMSQATGLDNSQLLPPYFPILRGEDFLFASMVLYLHPDSAVLDYGWSVPHLPAEQRSGQGSNDPIAARGGLSICADYLTDRVDYAPGVAPETQLQKLALLLRDLSERTPEALLAAFRTELAEVHANQLQQLANRLQQTPALNSRDWETYLQRAIEEVSRALQSPTDPSNIPGVPDNLPQRAFLQRVKEILAEFGCALEAWPSMRESASRIADEMLASGELIP